LDVGCGPSGIIFQIENAKPKVGLEPRDMQDFTLEIERYAKSIIIRGVGEELPFQSNAFDLVLSFNSLDHCRDPAKVIQEIYRVLKDNGELLIWLYTLRNEYKILQPLLNALDSPHPYHITASEILALLVHNLFHIKSKNYDKGTNLPNDTLKKIIGNRMMSTAWICANKSA
jgi:ubiquinone/menaquinone biosynthesis C-methylase UbiE